MMVLQDLAENELDRERSWRAVLAGDSVRLLPCTGAATWHHHCSSQPATPQLPPGPVEAGVKPPVGFSPCLWRGGVGSSDTSLPTYQSLAENRNCLGNGAT